MSDLQLSLLVIGVVVVCAVYLYNWLQERSYYRRIQQAFGKAHDDVLLKAGVESALADGRLEPLIVPAEGAHADLRVSAVPGGGAPVHEFDPILDFVCEIDADGAIPDAALNDLASNVAPCGKPVRIAGFDPQSGSWSELDRGEGAGCTRLRVALQLVNRAGPVNSAQLAAFCDAVSRCAERLSAAATCPEMGPALRRARDLDVFCAGVDVAIGVNVVAEGGGMFSGAKIRELAQEAGFKLEPDGVFHFHDERRGTLFTLDNHEPAPFLPERIRALSTKGLTLLLDVPRAATGAEVIDRMIEIANGFAETLGGRLVDDNRAALSDSGIAAIKDQVRTIRATMEAQGFSPGGTRALRLFSG